MIHKTWYAATTALYAKTITGTVGLCQLHEGMLGAHHQVTGQVKDLTHVKEQA